MRVGARVRFHRPKVRAPKQCEQQHQRHEPRRDSGEGQKRESVLNRRTVAMRRRAGRMSGRSDATKHARSLRPLQGGVNGGLMREAPRSATLAPVGKYRIVRQADGSYDIVASKPKGQLIVPGFKSEDDARIWLASMPPDERAERSRREE
jgi:hypothetical protein